MNSTFLVPFSRSPLKRGFYRRGEAMWKELKSIEELPKYGVRLLLYYRIHLDEFEYDSDYFIPPSHCVFSAKFDEDKRRFVNGKHSWTDQEILDTFSHWTPLYEENNRPTDH